VADGARFLTTDWILAEFLNAMSPVAWRSAAARAVAAMRASSLYTVAPADRAGWDSALELYTQRQDKEWSLIDCVSVLHCRTRGIRRVFTADRHFVQAGFRILLGS